MRPQTISCWSWSVSAQGVNFLIEYYSGTKNETGTSASTSTFAAIISLLNDVRSSADKGTLGFLNTWLYSSGYAALNDITERITLALGFKVSMLRKGGIRSQDLEHPTSRSSKSLSWSEMCCIGANIHGFSFSSFAVLISQLTVLRIYKIYA